MSIASFPLKPGSQGDNIVDLQNALNDIQDDDGNNLFSLDTNGVMDDPTVGAINTLHSMNPKAFFMPLSVGDYNSIVEPSSLEGVLMHAEMENNYVAPEPEPESEEPRIAYEGFGPHGHKNFREPRTHRQVRYEEFADQGREEQLHFSLKPPKWLKKDLISVANAENKAGKAIGTGIKNAAKAVEKVLKEAVNVLKNLGEDIVFAPLLPFKPAMKKKIAEAGLTTDNSMVDVINKFGKAIGAHNHFEGLHADATDIPAPEPGVDTTDKNYADLINEGLNQVTPVMIKPAPPVPQIIVTAVTVAGHLIGLSDASCLSVAQMIWGFLHHQKQIPGSDVHSTIAAIHDAHKKDNKDEVMGEIKIGKFKIKVAVFAPVAIFLLVGIITAIVIIKKHSKKS